MDFILKRRTLISMLFIGLSMLGWFSYKKLSLELIPNFLPISMRDQCPRRAPNSTTRRFLVPPRTRRWSDSLTT